MFLKILSIKIYNKILDKLYTCNLNIFEEKITICVVWINMYYSGIQFFIII